MKKTSINRYVYSTTEETYNNIDTLQELAKLEFVERVNNDYTDAIDDGNGEVDTDVGDTCIDDLDPGTLIFVYNNLDYLHKIKNIISKEIIKLKGDK